MTRSRWPAVLMAAGVTTGIAPDTQALQGPPGTDIHLVSLSSLAGRLHVGTARNLTERPGYDNQPAFSPDGATLWYTSIGPAGQADVCRVVLQRGERRCVETRSESEYSPTPMPGGGISVVRVEADSAQRLWRLDDAGQWSLILPQARPVGYHAWLDSDRVLLFLLGNPAVAVLANRTTGHMDTVARNVGRSLHRIPGTSTLSFPQRIDTTWWVMRFDPAGAGPDPVAPAPAGAQDHAWLPDGSLLMARGNRLYRWTSGTVGWELLHAFSEPGLQRISRLAVSPAGDRLALVGQESRP